MSTFSKIHSAYFDYPRKASSRFALPRTCVTKKQYGSTVFVYAVRAGVIETPSQPWEGRILPLNHARITVLYTKCKEYVSVHEQIDSE